MGKVEVLSYLSESLGSSCDLDYVEIEETGTGGIELFCRTCGNSEMSDTIAEAKERFICLLDDEAKTK